MEPTPFNDPILALKYLVLPYIFIYFLAVAIMIFIEWFRGRDLEGRDLYLYGVFLMLWPLTIPAMILSLPIWATVTRPIRLLWEKAARLENKVIIKGRQPKEQEAENGQTRSN